MDAVTSETRSSVSPYAVFDRASWRALAAGSRLPLDEAELRELATFGDRIDLDEVATVYLPLAGLLDLHVVGQPAAVGRAGGVPRQHAPRRCPSSSPSPAASRSARAPPPGCCRRLLARRPGSPRVDLVTTDGFLMPNAALEARGLLRPQGLPGELRPAGAAPLPRRREVRPRRGRRPGLRPPVLRHRAGRASGGRPAGHPRRRGSQRAAGRTARRRHRARGVPLGLLRLLRLRRRRRERHPALVRRAFPGACAGRRSRTPTPTSTASPG